MGKNPKLKVQLKCNFSGRKVLSLKAALMKPINRHLVYNLLYYLIYDFNELNDAIKWLRYAGKQISVCYLLRHIYVCRLLLYRSSSLCSWCCRKRTGQKHSCVLHHITLVSMVLRRFQLVINTLCLTCKAGYCLKEAKREKSPF